MFLLWQIWLSRNDYIFNNQSISQTHLVHKTVQLATEFYYLAYPAKYITIQLLRIIKWIVPSKPFIKLNIDGSFLGNPGLVGASGILRDFSGNWVSGFSLHLSLASNNITKLWAIRQGPMLAWDLGFKFNQLETNSTMVISWLTTNGNLSPDMVPLISNCRNLME